MAKFERFLPKAYDSDTPEEVREFYDRWADTYDRELEDSDYVGPAVVVAAFVEHCDNRDAAILDVGAGDHHGELIAAEPGDRCGGREFGDQARVIVWVRLERADVVGPEESVSRQ